jgi:hypothetical protein
MLAAFFPADQHVLRPDAYRGTLTPSRNRTVALQKANEITLIAANLSATYNPTVPTDVARLDYYGRALEFLVSRRRHLEAAGCCA